MATKSDYENPASGARGTSTLQNQNTSQTQKSQESWWKVAKKTGNVYVEYDTAAQNVLQNPAGYEPLYEMLTPEHLDKNDNSKHVWHSPLGITYYLQEGNDSRWDDDQKKFVPLIDPATNQPKKKWLVYRVLTSEYKSPEERAKGGGGAGGSGKYSKIVDQTTVVQIIRLDSEDFASSLEAVQPSKKVSEMMAEGWKVPQVQGVEFKQIKVDNESRLAYIFYTLVKKEYFGN